MHEYVQIAHPPLITKIIFKQHKALTQYASTMPCPRQCQTTHDVHQPRNSRKHIHDVSTFIKTPEGDRSITKCTANSELTTTKKGLATRLLAFTRCSTHDVVHPNNHLSSLRCRYDHLAFHVVGLSDPQILHIGDAPVFHIYTNRNGKTGTAQGHAQNQIQESADAERRIRESGSNRHFLHKTANIISTYRDPYPSCLWHEQP